MGGGFKFGLRLLAEEAMMRREGALGFSFRSAGSGLRVSGCWCSVVGVELQVELRSLI